MTPLKTPDADQLGHLTRIVHDNSSAVQAMQSDMHHLVKNVEKLVVVAEKQTELSHELSRHSDSIERAFAQMDGVKSDLAKSIDGLTAAFKEDRDKAGKIAETVTKYQGGLKMLMIVGSTVTALLLMIGGMFSLSIDREVARTNAAVAALDSDFDRRKLAVDLELRALDRALQALQALQGGRSPALPPAAPNPEPAPL